MEIKKVGVIGCGTMGSGIAQVCAQSGYQVVVSEINDELLNKGLASIDTFLTKGIERGKVTQEDKVSTLSRLKGTTSMKDFGDCDLVIEAATENMDVKKKMFAELDKICPEHVILATNTSSLSVTDVAAATSRGDKVLGMHFFNPAQIMRLLELIKTIATSDETIETARKFGESLKKNVVIAPDTPCFIVNRLAVLYQLEAIRMLEAGIATREDIDTGVTSGLGHPMGPLTLNDLVGLDVLYHIANVMYEETKRPEYAPPTLLKKMVATGWLGRKTGKGFYEYNK